MNKVERLARNQQIAEEIRSGTSAEAMATKWNLSGASISNICRLAGIKVSTHDLLRFPARPFQILHDLVHTEMSLSSVAQKHSVSLQRVAQIYHNAEASGWTEMPPRHQGVSVNSTEPEEPSKES